MTRCSSAILIVALVVLAQSVWGLKNSQSVQWRRRRIVEVGFGSTFSILKSGRANAAGLPSNIQILEKTSTYPAIISRPPGRKGSKTPCILFLHGAGINDSSDIVDSLGSLGGQYGGLLPSLMINSMAPAEAIENFIVLAPYSIGSKSFYEDPRSKLLTFLQDMINMYPEIDADRISIFGFSDGATVAVELLTTRKFSSAVICSYGFVGTLPDKALQRLANIPVWVLHSSDDVIFKVGNSDRLVRSLRQNGNKVRYDRFESDPENFPGSVRGHTTGITASKNPAIYQWLLQSH